MSDFINLFLLTFLGSIAGIIGGAILLYKEKWASTLSHISIPFAAGVLLAVSFLDLLPEAVENGNVLAFQIVLFVFVSLYLIEKYFFSLHHHTDNGRSFHSAVVYVIVGDTIHNFLDGVTIAAAYIIDPWFGFLVAFSTFLHETPHEIADFGILLAVGWKPKKVFMANFLSALATFPGAFIGYMLVKANMNFVGILLATSAALFLYVSTTDFLPSLEENKKSPYNQSVFFVLGVLIIVSLRILIPELNP